MDRVGASALWEIEGYQVSLAYKTKYPEDILKKEIINYRNCLLKRSYVVDNIELLKAYRVFGGISFVAIGMTLEDEFKECFRFFAECFAQEWAVSTQCLQSKFVGIEYVFQIMLQDKEEPILYNFRYILEKINQSSEFPEILEDTFAEYWVEKMIPLMRKGKSLAYVTKRIGDARVSRYFMKNPVETEKYLQYLAGQYTKKRLIITKRDLSRYIFGNRGDSKFSGGDLRFFTLFEKVVQNEFDVQKIDFVNKNHDEWSSYKDIWRIYKVVGVTLKYMQLDFRKIKSPSLAQELKHFLRDRFKQKFMANEKNLSSLFDIANLIIKINPNIIYFADMTETDVKTLQLTLENQWTQTHIMSSFSICRILFDYLVSPSNTSKLPAPNENIFRNIRMVNSKKYRKSTNYIPDCVLEKLQEYLHELHP